MGTECECNCGCGNVVPPERIVQLIDHTLLKPEATTEQIERLCVEAREYGFAAVCVNPTYVALCADRLKGSAVHVCTVVGFPLGAHLPEIKAAETERAIQDGATELDMVINIGALKEGRDDLVRRDIQGVAEACHKHKAICKVIIECALLTDDEKVRACELSKQAGADYVKTSTGFASSGAMPEDVALMSKTVRDANLGVKAAGGIRTYADVRKMIAAGATRIGASAGVKILEEARAAATTGNDS